MRKRILACLAAVLLSACASGPTNFPTTTINGATIGGGSSYCIFLSAFVGALSGGTLGSLVSNTVGSTGNETVAWGTMSTAFGAGLGGLTGYGLCGPTTDATKGSESIVR
jgi:hypothetical protein